MGKFLIIVLFSGLILGGCSQATTPNEQASSGHFPNLQLQLTADPAQVYIDKMPTTNPQPQPRDILFTLTVTNGSRSDFQGTSPTTATAHYMVMQGNQKLWEGPPLAGQLVLPVHIAPGETFKCTPGQWHIDDARALGVGDLTVWGVFVPNGDKTSITVPVKIAQ